MKYIFLDVDGPLNNLDTYESMVEQFPNVGIKRCYGLSQDVVFKQFGCLYLIDTWMLNNLYTIVQAFSDVSIIGISSWFRSGRDSCRGRTIFKELTGLTIDDTIDYTGGGDSRYRSIDRYVERYGIESYVIIDDIPNEHNHLVQIDRDGLTIEKAQDAIRKMNNIYEKS